MNATITRVDLLRREAERHGDTREIVSLRMTNDAGRIEYELQQQVRRLERRAESIRPLAEVAR